MWVKIWDSVYICIVGCRGALQLGGPWKGAHQGYNQTFTTLSRVKGSLNEHKVYKVSMYSFRRFTSRMNTTRRMPSFKDSSWFILGSKALKFASLSNLKPRPQFADIWRGHWNYHRNKNRSQWLKDHSFGTVPHAYFA